MPEPDPIKIFNTRNPTRTWTKIFFNLKPDPNLKNFYVTILKLKIFKSAYNIRISIGYKNSICQVFGTNQIFFKTWIKEVSIFFRKKVGFKSRTRPE